jgi:hypothetical protein
MLAPRKRLWSTPLPVVSEALTLLSLSPTDTLVDYGCGKGDALLLASRTYGCRSIGYEIESDRVTALRQRIAASSCVSGLIEVRHQNALTADPSEPTAVFLFLVPHGLRQMLPLLQRVAAHQPSRVLRLVTILYPFPGLKQERTVWVSVSPDVRTPIYLYLLPAL